MLDSIKLSLAVCITGVNLTACATTPPAPQAYRPPVPGLVVVYSYVENGKGDPSKPSIRQEIVSNDGDFVVNIMTDLKDGTLRDSRTFRAIVTERVYQRGDGIIVERIQQDTLRRLWPLAPGKTAKSTGQRLFARGRTEKFAENHLKPAGRIDYIFRILRREKLVVPAGTFDTVVFQRVATIRDMKGKISLVSDKTYWLALDLGWLVRLDTVNTRPGHPAVKARLTAIRVTRPGKTAK